MSNLDRGYPHITMKRSHSFFLERCYERVDNDKTSRQQERLEWIRTLMKFYTDLHATKMKGLKIRKQNDG